MYQISKLLIFVLSTLLFSLPANTSEYIFEQFSLDEGLPSLEIQQTFQQSNGFIWFATSRGASRYDGYSFRHFYFSPNSVNHISNNFISKIAEDKTGNIWLATEDGLNRINIDGSIDIFKDSDGLPSSWILTVFIDSKDRLWIGTAQGLALYQKSSKDFNKIGNASYIGVIFETNNGDILASTYDGLKKLGSDGVTLTDISIKHPKFDLLRDSYILDIKALANGWVAIGTEYNGLFLINFATDEIIHHNQNSGLKGNSVASITQIGNDQLWLAHYFNGISILNLKTNEISFIQNTPFDDYSIVSNTIRNIFQDSSGIVWIATNQGVSKLPPQQKGVYIYRALPDGKGLSGETVNMGIAYGSDSSLVVNSGGVDLIDHNTRMVTPNIFSSLGNTNEKVEGVYSLASNQKQIWMASEKGLYLFDIEKQKLLPFSNPIGNQYELPTQELYTVLSEPSGGVWFTGYNRVGLSLFHPDKGVIRRFMHTDKSIYTREGNYSTETILSSLGEIWMATTDGLFRVNRETGDYQHYKLGGTKIKRDYIRVSSVREGKPGVFWATTDGLGLVKIQTIADSSEVQISYFNTEQGFPNNELTSLAVGDNTIWLTSNNQLIKFTISSKEVQVFENLFNIRNLNFMPASARLMGNKLFIGSTKGYFEIDINAIELSQYSPQIVITDVLSDKDSVYQSINKISMVKNLILDLAGDDIEFHFAALDFSNPEHNRFSYHLLGYDERWSDATSAHSASYSNLLPGEYTFQVKGTNSDNVWSNNIAQFRVNITVPYWYYIVAILLSLTIILFIQFVVIRRRQVKLLNQQLRHDTLTNLPNRFDYQSKLAKLVSAQEHKFALIILDLDRLKEVNDLYGHKVGDEYIKSAAQRMQASLRDFDYLARLSGDEFIILLNRYKLEEDLLEMVNRITVNLSKPYLFDEITVTGSASLGVAVFPKDGKSEEELFVHADSAMYEAKKAGRNQAYFFNALLKTKLVETLNIKANLKHALSNQEFELFYQAKLNPITHSIDGFEALIRWFHPVEGLIPPDKFISEAENSGAIVEIGQWVIETACTQAAILHGEGLLKGNVSVNVSPKQLLTSDIVAVVINALEVSGLPPENLELEITESSLMDESDRTHILLSKLKNIGVSIALDDFGTGYSSLSYLTKYPISTLKIDRSIIVSASKQQTSLLVLRNIYSLAHSLGIKAVSEGVETQEQANLILQYKNDLVQGYLYSRPIPFEDARQLLIANVSKI
jgi:diguanylate cyclase (GGDEF)-like protein